DIILGQLLLTDFTVVKIMLTAVVTGMIGIYFLRSLGLVKLQPKAGSVGMNVFGGLFFGIGFAVLGYCPGTAVGAVGNGFMDALVGGLLGMLAGAGIFAAIYPRMSKSVLQKGYFGELTFPELFKVNPWVMVIIFSVLIVGVLYLLENAGL
ncbi:MAG: YeeE/YedE family protein, partial [bacterium]|nr:YeeE/YedE family protein [bacterium]